MPPSINIFLSLPFIQLKWLVKKSFSRLGSIIFILWKILSFLSKFIIKIPKEISCILTHLNSRPLLQASSMLARLSNMYLYPSLKIPLNFPSYIHCILLLFLLLFISLNYLSFLSAVTKNTHFHDNKATKNSTKSN